MTYDPFGAPLASQPPNTIEHLFTGEWNKQYDTSSGLVLMGARPYDPSLGRFLAVDPVDGGSLNNYDYAGQDPINNYDLDGRSFGHWLKKHVLKPAEDHAGTIAIIADAAVFVPGLDVVAIPVAIGFGSLQAYKDRHHPAALTLDIVGLAGSGAAVLTAAKAASLEKAALASIRSGPIADWLRTDASVLRKRSLFISIGGFGFSVVTSRRP